MAERQPSNGVRVAFMHAEGAMKSSEQTQMQEPQWRSMVPPPLQVLANAVKLPTLPGSFSGGMAIWDLLGVSMDEAPKFLSTIIQKP